MKRHRNKIIAGCVIAALLVGTFFLGGGIGGGTRKTAQQEAGEDSDFLDINQANDRSWSLKMAGSHLPDNTPINPETRSQDSGPYRDETDDATGNTGGDGIVATDQGGAEARDGHGQASSQPTDSSQQMYMQGSETAEAAQQNSPSPTVPSDDSQHGSSSQPVTPAPTQETPAPDGNTADDAQVPFEGERELTVTLLISVATVVDNMDRLTDGKAGLIPRNGVIFDGKVVFYEGESVFNVLQRETKRNRIHMEFVNTPIYNSAYIEGINNIYEFDVGERSGWMYSVNGNFPNYGSSRYTLRDGDVVKWLYTCDRGADIGGGDASDSYSFGR